jgi:hypothetical protein
MLQSNRLVETVKIEVSTRRMTKRTNEKRNLWNISTGIDSFSDWKKHPNRLTYFRKANKIPFAKATSNEPRSSFRGLSYGWLDVDQTSTKTGLLKTDKTKMCQRINLAGFGWLQDNPTPIFFVCASAKEDENHEMLRFWKSEWKCCTSSLCRPLALKYRWLLL